MGPSFLGVKKERPAIAQPHQGIEHGASSRNSQMFTPVPIALCRGVLVVDVYIGVLMCLRLLGFCVRVIIEGPSGLPLCR